MSELRKDPIVDRWVIISPERANRPIFLKSEAAVSSDAPCPFCEGNEQQTPPELLAFRSSDSPANGRGWRVRVVPNSFPALASNGELHSDTGGLYQSMPGIGAHEVVIECPFHEVSTGNLTVSHMSETLRAYRDRLIALKKDTRFAYGLVFKNVGIAAGASLDHLHSQIIVTPIVPVAVQDELNAARAYHDQHGRCIYCDLIHRERFAEERMVIETPRFVGFAPYASRFPYETWILPKTHDSHFENQSDLQLDELAESLKSILMKLEVVLDVPSYNYVIHTSPFGISELPSYHWHLEILPRTTRIAGFEWGSGFHINTLPPEQAAATLRKS